MPALPVPPIPAGIMLEPVGPCRDCPAMSPAHTQATFVSVCSVPPVFCVRGMNMSLGADQTQGQSLSQAAVPPGLVLPSEHPKNREHPKTRPILGGIKPGELQELLVPSLIQSTTNCLAAEQERLERHKVTQCVTKADLWTQHGGNFRDLSLLCLQQPGVGGGWQKL